MQVNIWTHRILLEHHSYYLPRIDVTPLRTIRPREGPCPKKRPLLCPLQPWQPKVRGIMGQDQLITTGEWLYWISMGGLPLRGSGQEASLGHWEGYLMQVVHFLETSPPRYLLRQWWVWKCPTGRSFAHIWKMPARRAAPPLWHNRWMGIKGGWERNGQLVVVTWDLKQFKGLCVLCLFAGTMDPCLGLCFLMLRMMGEERVHTRLLWLAVAVGLRERSFPAEMPAKQIHFWLFFFYPSLPPTIHEDM